MRLNNHFQTHSDVAGLRIGFPGYPQSHCTCRGRLAGTAHPNAGEPDILAMAHGFYSEWTRMVSKGMIKAVPRGSAYQSHYESESHSDDDGADEHSRMARDRVTNRIICGVCGGIGHAGNVDGVGTCLTARLGNRVPSQDLAKITYPAGYTPPKFFTRPGPNSRPPRPHDRRSPAPPRTALG